MTDYLITAYHLREGRPMLVDFLDEKGGLIQREVEDHIEQVHFASLCGKFLGPSFWASGEFIASRTLSCWLSKRELLPEEVASRLPYPSLMYAVRQAGGDPTEIVSDAIVEGAGKPEGEDLIPSPVKREGWMAADGDLCRNWFWLENKPTWERYINEWVSVKGDFKFVHGFDLNIDSRESLHRVVEIDGEFYLRKEPR